MKKLIILENKAFDINFVKVGTDKVSIGIIKVGDDGFIEIIAEGGDNGPKIAISELRLLMKEIDNG